MKNLINKASGYKKATQKLIAQLKELQNSILPDIFFKRFSYEHAGFAPNYMNSNIGQWGSALFYINEDRETFPLPEYIEECGTFHYMHNDFNRGFRYATRKQVLVIAQTLPLLLEKWQQFCAEETILSEKSSETLAKMIDSLKER
jgi:hypothetical protein